MSSEQREQQRRNFVYGNTRLDNEAVTPELVNGVGDSLALQHEVRIEELKTARSTQWSNALIFMTFFASCAYCITN